MASCSDISSKAHTDSMSPDISSSRSVCLLCEEINSSISVGDRAVVRVEANRHAQGGFALSVHEEGIANVADRIAKEVLETAVPFICSFSSLTGM